MNTTDQRSPSARVAVMVADGFEQSELLDPAGALRDAGADVAILTPDGEPVRGWKDKNWGQTIKADAALEGAKAGDYQALLLPGGVLNSDALRASKEACDFARHFFQEGKPVFVICHGAQLLIDAGVLDGRTLTSYPAIALDLINAGANWQDQEVVEDGNLISSRTPDDLPAFCDAICRALGIL